MGVNLAEADDFVELDAEAPERVGEDVLHRVSEIVVAVILPFVNVALEKPLTGITERLQKPVFGFEMLAPDIRIVIAGEDHLDFVHSLEGEWASIGDW